MLTTEQVERFRADGFVKGGRVIDDATVESLRHELDSVLVRRNDLHARQPVLLRNISREQSPIWQVVNIWEASEAYRQLMYNRQICEEAAQLTGAEQLRVWHDQIQYKPAAHGGMNMWHQDSPAWSNLMPKTTQISAWVALDDVDESNGCMSMVVGSHLWKTYIGSLGVIPSFDGLPAQFEGHRVEVRLCPVKKGEVHFHHCLTWHGSHANLSDRPRRAIAIHYMTQDTLYDSAGDHPMNQFAGHLTHGQRMEGEHFPLTWERTHAAAAAAGN